MEVAVAICPFLVIDEIEIPAEVVSGENIQTLVTPVIFLACPIKVLVLKNEKGNF